MRALSIQQMQGIPNMSDCQSLVSQALGQVPDMKKAQAYAAGEFAKRKMMINPSLTFLYLAYFQRWDITNSISKASDGRLLLLLARSIILQSEACSTKVVPRIRLPLFLPRLLRRWD